VTNVVGADIKTKLKFSLITLLEIFLKESQKRISWNTSLSLQTVMQFNVHTLEFHCISLVSALSHTKFS